MRKFLSAACVLFAVTAASNAATIVYNYSVGPVGTLNTDFNVPTFQTGLGTLTSVELDWSVSYNPNGTTITNGAQAQQLRVLLQDSAALGTDGQYFSWDALGGTGIVVYAFNSTKSNPANAYTESQTKTYNSVAQSKSDTLILNQSADLAPFHGVVAGFYAIPVFALDTFAIDPGVGANGVNVSLQSSQTSTLRVTYTYDLVGVPEPATFVLIGSTLIGLGLLSRRRTAA